MLKKILSFCVFVLLISTAAVSGAASNLDEGVGQLAGQISKSMQEKQAQKIAILDFSDLNGNVTALGQFMAEELTTQLFLVAPGKFEVVERRQLMKLEEELMLSQTGFIEEKGIKKMGQVFGVDAVVTGSITDLGNTIKINARLLGVETAKVFAVAATDIPKTGMVADLIRQVASKPQSSKNGQTAQSAEVQPQKADEKKDVASAYVWDDGSLKVTIESFKKSGKNINVAAIFENISDKALRVSIGGESHLLDEDGGRWAFSGTDTAELRNSRDIQAGKRVKTKMVFEARDGDSGTVFDMVIKDWTGHQYRLNIQNMKPN